MEKISECPYWVADTSLIYPGLSLKHGVQEVCRHWLGGVACRLWNMGPCPTEGRRVAGAGTGAGAAPGNDPLSYS